MTDLDALMGRLRDRNAAIDLRFRAEIIQTIEALRARLAPTTHADDEALLVGVTEAVRDMDDDGYNAAMDRVARRLAELRESEYAANKVAAASNARAEKAERALAECRNKTIDECAAEVEKLTMIRGSRWDTPENAAALIRALKTKEPRDG